MSENDYENWAAKRKLGSQSLTTQQLYENRFLSVQDYIIQFRKSAINSILPEEAKSIAVEDALSIGRIGNINIRKLLTDNREKFKKR